MAHDIRGSTASDLQYRFGPHNFELACSRLPVDALLIPSDLHGIMKIDQILQAS